MRRGHTHASEDSDAVANLRVNTGKVSSARYIGIQFQSVSLNDIALRHCLCPRRVENDVQIYFAQEILW